MFWPIFRFNVKSSIYWIFDTKYFNKNVKSIKTQLSTKWKTFFPNKLDDVDLLRSMKKHAFKKYKTNGFQILKPRMNDKTLTNE